MVVRPDFPPIDRIRTPLGCTCPELWLPLCRQSGLNLQPGFPGHLFQAKYKQFCFRGAVEWAGKHFFCVKRKHFRGVSAAISYPTRAVSHFPQSHLLLRTSREVCSLSWMQLLPWRRPTSPLILPIYYTEYEAHWEPGDCQIISDP